MDVFDDMCAAWGHDTFRVATLLARDGAYAPALDWACRALGTDVVSSSFAPNAQTSPSAARAALAAALAALRGADRARDLLPAACFRPGLLAPRDDGSVGFRVLAGRMNKDGEREAFLGALEHAVPGYRQWGVPFGTRYVCCAAPAAALKVEHAAAAAAAPAVAW